MAHKNMRFPLFVDLTGKPCVVIGGGAIACRRIQVLLDFGAAVNVISPRLKRQFPNITYVNRPYQDGDLNGAFLAVAATDDRAVNRAVGEEAARLGILVSVADCREECTFYFPAVCTGGGLIAGVVSDGTAHSRTAAAAREIRALLSEIDVTEGRGEA